MTAPITYRANNAFKVTVAPIANSGGHDHNDANRPFGRVRAFGVTDAPNGNEGNHTYQGVTGADGKAKVVYTASIVGGRDQITVKMSDHLTKVYEGEDGQPGMMVRIPGLQLLPNGNNYTKIGGTTTHHGPPPSATDNNHWGTVDTNTKLAQIADDYIALYPGGQLSFNDMSLPSGGIFDLNGNWTSGSGHAEHRLGRNCDLSDRIPESRWEAVEVILQRRQVGFNHEFDKHHWHLRF